MHAAQVDWLGFHRYAGNVAGDEQINRFAFHLLMTIRRKTFHDCQGRELSVRSALKTPSVMSAINRGSTVKRVAGRLAVDV